MKSVVIVGGGTGTFVLTRALSDLDIELTKIVTVFDDGGSTARLKDEFGFLPVGDLRQSLAALADDKTQSWIRDLLLYRFSKGNGLKGHNLGNLLLVALQDMTDSTPMALEIAAKIFRLKGKIYPVSLSSSQLKAVYQDGKQVIGEHHLDDEGDCQPIKDISLVEPCKIYDKAGRAMEQADIIIFGPGDLFGSIVPNLLVEGATQALKNSKAKLVYIVNLMTRCSQTHGFTAHDHVREIEKYAQRKMDLIVLSNGQVPTPIKNKYADYNEYPVIDDLANDSRVVRDNFISSTVVKPVAGDKIRRSLLRHDREKLKKLFAQKFNLANK